MKGVLSSNIAFALAVSLFLFSTAAVAQSTGDIPACAIPCFVAAVPSSGCRLDDRVCQCTTGKDAIERSVAECAPKVCKAEDVAKIKPAVKAICLEYGITLDALPPTPPPTLTATAMPDVHAATSTVANGTANATGSGRAPEFTNAAAGGFEAVERIGGWLWRVSVGVLAGLGMGMGIREL